MASWFLSEWNRDWFWRHEGDEVCFSNEGADKWVTWRVQRMKESLEFVSGKEVCPNCLGLDSKMIASRFASAKEDVASAEDDEYLYRGEYSGLKLMPLVEYVRTTAERGCPVCDMIIKSVAHFGLIDYFRRYWEDLSMQEIDHPYMWTHYESAEDKAGPLRWVSELVPIPKKLVPQNEEETGSAPENTASGAVSTQHLEDESDVCFCQLCATSLHMSSTEKNAWLRRGFRWNEDFERFFAGDTANISMTLSGEKEHKGMLLEFFCLEFDRLHSTGVRPYGCESPWSAIQQRAHFPQSTRSDDAFDILKEWLCESDAATKLFDTEPELPTRVLDVSSNPIKVLESKHSRGQYAVLSHCWGKKADGHEPPKLTKAKYSAYTKEVTEADLNVIIRDAVEITRKIGLRYLWVDSLCIVQDDAHDWDSQSAQMFRIYRESYISIMNPKAMHGDIPAFTEDRYTRGRWTPSQAPLLVHESGSSAGANVYTAPFIDHYQPNGDFPVAALLPDEPIFSRAWILQEFFLAPRVIMYGLCELVMMTNDGDRCECGGQNLGGTYLKQEIQKNVKNFHEKSDNNWSRDFWHQLIETYSGRALTKDVDRLAALSGLAQMLKPTQDDVYHAGLWQSRLIDDLRWKVEKTTRRSRMYIGPSWSWVSVKGEVRYPFSALTRNIAKVVACHCVLNASDQYGRVKDGRLTLSARVKEVVAYATPKETLRLDDSFYEYKLSAHQEQAHKQTANDHPQSNISGSESTQTTTSKLNKHHLPLRKTRTLALKKLVHRLPRKKSDPSEQPRSRGKASSASMKLDDHDKTPPILSQAADAKGKSPANDSSLMAEDINTTGEDSWEDIDPVPGEEDLPIPPTYPYSSVLEPDYAMNNLRRIHEADQSIWQHLDASGNLQLPFEQFFGPSSLSAVRGDSSDTDQGMIEFIPDIDLLPPGKKGKAREVRLLALLLGETESGDEEALLLRKKEGSLGEKQEYERVGFLEHGVKSKLSIGLIIGGGNLNVKGRSDESWFQDGEEREVVIV